MAVAKLGIDGRYRASAPEEVGEPGSLIGRLRDRTATSASALLGFDFPIGLPAAYATSAKISDFEGFLGDLSPHSSFFRVCRKPDEISLSQPFYPYAPGGTRRRHLETGLGIPFSELFRRCDRTNAQRPEAGALFWTIGAKQVGKGAIAGWKEVLGPALSKGKLRLWPFAGTLPELLQPGVLVAAETYPAQYYSGIFPALGGSKRDAAVRSSVASRILEWSEQNGISLTSELDAQIRQGFPHGADDAFDAAIGLLGMIAAIQGYSDQSEPSDSVVRKIEGWILGQPKLAGLE